MSPSRHNNTDLPQYPGSSYESQENFATNLYAGPRMKENKPKRKTRILALLFATLLTLFGMYAYPIIFDDNPSEGSSLNTDTQRTEEEIRQDLDEKVETGMMNITISPRLVVDEHLQGEIGIENIPGNHVDQRVKLETFDGTLLYESDYISPGDTIDIVTLVRAPEEPTETIYAIFTGYDRTTHAEIGSMSVEIELIQKGKEQ